MIAPDDATLIDKQNCEAAIVIRRGARSRPPMADIITLIEARAAEMLAIHGP